MLEVARGHEIWVLPEGGHAHEGREVRCRIFYGHAMRADGLPDLTRLAAWAVVSEGRRLPLKVEPDTGEFHVVRFTPDRDGFWPVTVENDVGPIALTKDGSYRRGTREEYPDAREVGYYYQYAKTYIQVGHFCAACGGVADSPEILRLGHDLELIAIPSAYRVGDGVLLEVRYRGRPLPGAEVKATWSLYEKTDWALAQKTNDAGLVRFTLRAPGHWLFYTRYGDDTLAEEGAYDRRVYSATLTLFGVR